MLVKFEQNLIVRLQTTRNFELFDKNKNKTKQNKTKQNKTKQNKTKQKQKTGFLKTNFDKALTPFWKTFL